jgi:serine/threonine protein kinase
MEQYNKKQHSKKQYSKKQYSKPKTQKISKYILKGGKFIDEGGFSCVVSPAIGCSTNDINLDKSISKLIRNPDSHISNEIKLSNILKSIDPLQKYYITINNYCYLKNIPSDRKDIISVKYTDSDLKEFHVSDDSIISKNSKQCDVDLSLKPINLIMPYGGLSLSTIMKTSLKSKGIKAEIHMMFINNIKTIFKHLILGIVKMHNNRIVNRDIKQRNIMLSLNKSKNILLTRYIDFGLSEFLTDALTRDVSNISYKGTKYYCPPEIFICSVIKNYSEEPNTYKMKKINGYLEDSILIAFNKLGEKHRLKTINKFIETLYNKIQSLFNSNKILETFFGTNKNKFNGYLQKADVYGLGITIYETLANYSDINVKKDEKLYDLLLHMIEIDPDKRYNVIQCLSHPYFR